MAAPSKKRGSVMFKMQPMDLQSSATKDVIEKIAEMSL
tara:strand:+ start:1255 stop:1368 length:114 start_codon:yes stop_codon:yes gene_type:complete